MTIAELASRGAGLLPLWSVPLGMLVWLGFYGAARRWPPRRCLWLAQELIPLGGLVAAFLLFFWRPLLTSAEVPRGGGDLNSYFFPLHAFSADRISQGDLPLWNPHLHAGMPQLANYQAALLYPINLAAWALPGEFSYARMEALALVHYLIASLGAYLLARSLGLSRLPAFAAGALFPYSGFLVAHLGHYTMLSASAWLPWLLLAVYWLVRRRGWAVVTATGLAVFLMASAGHQQTLLYGLTAAGLWWLLWIALRHRLLTVCAGHVTSQWRPRRTTVWPLLVDGARFVLAIGLGLGLAAPVILPSLQLAGRSVRTGLSYEQATEFSVQPVALLQFILPKAFGSNPTDYWGPFSNGEIWAYVGVVTLLLAGLALATRATLERLFFAGLGLLALLYALGPAAPLHGWLFRFVPLYDLVRAPARGYLLVDLALVLLAAYGLAELTDRGAGLVRVRAVGSGLARALLVVLAALALFVIPLFYSLILGVNDPSNRPVIAVDGLNLLLLYLTAATVLIWLFARGRLGGPLAAALLLALALLDLYGATATFNPTPEDLTAAFRHQQAISFLQDRMRTDGRFRIEATAPSWQPDLALLAGLDDIGGLFDPMQPAAYAQAREVSTSQRSLPLYDLLNARYLITAADAAAPGPDFREALRTSDGLVIWENSSALPRAWLAYQAREVDEQQALQAIRQPRFDPRRDLLLTGSLPAAGPAGQGTVTISDYLDDRVRLRVETDQSAYLVLADLAYPGWTAQVDGVDVPIATADGLFRAVSVPVGSHDVVFRFEPPLARAGALVAAVSLILLLALAVVDPIRARRRA